MILMVLALAAGFEHTWDPWPPNQITAPAEVRARENNLQGPSPAITASFSPIRLSATRRLLGRGREGEIGLWNIRTCNHGNSQSNVNAGMVLDAAWEIPFLTDTQARDIISRNQEESGRGRWIALLTLGLGIGSAVALGQSDTRVSGILTGTSVGVQLLRDFLVARKPDLSRVLAQGIPEWIVLAPKECKTYAAFASLTSGAKPMRRVVE